MSAVLATRPRYARKLKIVLAGNVTPEVESSDSKKETGKAGNGQDKVKKENILVPDIKTVENVCKKALEQSDHKFALKESYIHFHLSSGSGIITEYDNYDLLHEDLEWFKEYMASYEAEDDHPTPTDDTMEKLIDMFEKETGKLTRNYKAEFFFPLETAVVFASKKLEITGKFVEDVYRYWTDKRDRLGKALMRKFHEPPPHDDTSPSVAFRPREREKRQTRNLRRNDHAAFRKMEFLKSKDFDLVFNICDKIRKREIRKRDLNVIESQLFDAQLQDTNLRKIISVFGSADDESLLKTPMSNHTHDYDLNDYRTKTVHTRVTKRSISMTPKEVSRPTPSITVQHTPSVITQLFPTLPIFSEPIDKLLTEGVVVSREDNESSSEKKFYNKVETFLGLIEKPKRQKLTESPISIYSPPISTCKGKVKPVITANGSYEMEIRWNRV